MASALTAHFVLITLVSGAVGVLAQGAGAQAPAGAQPTVTYEPAAASLEPVGEEPRRGAGQADGSRWELEFHPAVWYTGLAGKVNMPRGGGGGSVNSGTRVRDLNLESPRVTPFGELNLTKGDWLIELRGAAFSTDRDGAAEFTGSIGDVNFTPGSPLRSSFDFQSFEIQGGYRILERNISPLSGERGGGYKLQSDIYALAGVRLLAVDFSIANLADGLVAVEQSEDTFSAHPTLGLKWNVDFYNDFRFTAEVNGGLLPLSDDESYGFDIVIGGQWRFSKHVGVTIGYRALFFGVASGEEDNQFEVSQGSLQGLYAGVTIRF